MVESTQEVKTLPNELLQTVVLNRELISKKNKGNGESKFQKKSLSLKEEKPEKKRPYILASRQEKKESTVVEVGEIKIGGREVVVIAGPCSVESEPQMMEIAQQAREMGVGILRGGAYKPRTSTYSFQGLGEVGLKLLREAADKYGLKVVTEVMDTRDVELVGKYTDIYQVGSKSMGNYSLLKELGYVDKPVLLKRGMWADYEDFISAAEYILVRGNSQVILCERGISSFVKETRNTFDLNAIPYLKRETHLPVIADPSHATGDDGLVEPVSLGAVAAGADGLLIEACINPKESVSDADQSISMKKLASIMEKVRKVARAVGRDLWNGFG